MAEKVVIGNAELWHGDCREVLPLLPRFAAVVTDQPYGLGDILHKSGKNNPRWGKFFEVGPPTWDRATVDDGVKAAIAQAAMAVVWGGQFYIWSFTVIDFISVHPRLINPTNSRFIVTPPTHRQEALPLHALEVPHPLRYCFRKICSAGFTRYSESCSRNQQP